MRSTVIVSGENFVALSIKKTGAVVMTVPVI